MLFLISENDNHNLSHITEINHRIPNTKTKLNHVVLKIKRAHIVTYYYYNGTPNECMHCPLHSAVRRHMHVWLVITPQLLSIINNCYKNSSMQSAIGKGELINLKQIKNITNFQNQI
ncbi:hypothetical protein QTP88_020796 [Uroleucon formosanum]